MIKLLSIFCFVCFLASAFLFLYRKDSHSAAIPLILGAKASIIAAIISCSTSVIFFTALSAGFMVMLVFVSLSGGAVRASGKKEYAILLVFAALALVFFQGCNFKNTAIMPSPDGEIKFDFVPSEIATDNNEDLYVGMERGKSIYLYSVADKRPRAVLEAGMYPYDMIKTDKKLFVADKMGGMVTIFDLAAGKKADIDTKGKYPSAIAYDRQKNILYAANMGSGSVAVIDAATNKVLNLINTGRWPAGLLLSQDGRLLYVACKYTNTVEVIDAEKQQVVFTMAQVGTSPSTLVDLGKRDVAVINEWEYAYDQNGSVTIFDRREYRVKASYLIPGGASTGVLSKSRRYLYMAVPLKDLIVFMDLRKGAIVAELKLVKDSMPYFLALSKDGRKLYVTCPKQKKVEIIAVNGLI